MVITCRPKRVGPYQFSTMTLLSQRSDFQSIHPLGRALHPVFVGLVLGNYSGNLTYSERHLWGNKS